jgi:hypothetical protein
MDRLVIKLLVRSDFAHAYVHATEVPKRVANGPSLAKRVRKFRSLDGTSTFAVGKQSGNDAQSRSAHEAKSTEDRHHI